MNHFLQVLPYAVPSVAAVFTVPSIWHVAKNFRRGKDANYKGVYVDKDGVATKESMDRFSAKWPIILISFGVALGVAASFAFAVCATLTHSSTINVVAQPWLLCGSWVSGIIVKYFG